MLQDSDLMVIVTLADMLERTTDTEIHTRTKALLVRIFDKIEEVENQGQE